MGFQGFFTNRPNPLTWGDPPKPPFSCGSSGPCYCTGACRAKPTVSTPPPLLERIDWAKLWPPPKPLHDHDFID